MQDLSNKRDDFPMLQKTMHGRPLIYLDSAATTQKPQAVIDAVTRCYAEEYATVHRAVYELSVNASAQYHSVRQQVAQFINAPDPQEIIFTKGVTEAINLVAHSFGKLLVDMGDEVVITELEHHSNIVPWQLMCEERGAKLKVLPVNDRGELIMEECEQIFTSKTKIVSVGHISNSIGTLNPIKELVELAHEVGAKVFVDGAQGAAHLPVDVQDLGVDFYTFSGHKLYGPTGIGVLWGRKDLLEEMPPYQGGGDQIEKVTYEETTFNVLPYRFEAGTPNIAGVQGLGAAITYLQEIGLDAIGAWEHDLLVYATEQLKTLAGVRILGTAKEKGGIISFMVDGIHPLDLGTLLDLRGVAIRTGHHCAQPTMNRFGVPATARVSFGLYNNRGDVDAFVRALDEVIRSLV